MIAGIPVHGSACSQPTGAAGHRLARDVPEQLPRLLQLARNARGKATRHSGRHQSRRATLSVRQLLRMVHVCDGQAGARQAAWPAPASLISRALAHAEPRRAAVLLRLLLFDLVPFISILCHLAGP